MPTVRLVNPSPRGKRGYFGLRRHSWEGEHPHTYMARRKHHHHKHRRRRNPGFFGFRRRRNPVLGMSGADLLVETVAAVGNGVATRVVPQMILGSSNTGIVGYGANAITGLVGAWLAGKFNQKAGHGALLGAAVAVASRILSDTLGQNALGGGLSGDMGGELGFYINNSFPLPTASNGPLLYMPGYSGAPQLSIGLPGMAPTVVTSAAGTQAAAPGGAGGANAALASSTGSSAPGVWSQTPWAA